MSDGSWEKFARDDPYRAVLTDNGDQWQHDAAAFQRFFLNGNDFIETATSKFKKHFDRSIGPADAAIDFGCGVGRLTLPMAKRCRRVVGIDVSETMRETCIGHARRLRLHNVDCYSGLVELEAGSPRFDWLNSYIVFQHIETRQGYRLFDSLLRLLRSSAVISVHFTLFKDERHARFMTNTLRYFSVDETGVTDYYPSGDFYKPDEMMMNDYRLDRLVQIMRDNKFERYFIDMEDQDGMHGAIIYSIRSG